MKDIDNYMSVIEASDRYNVSEATIKMRLSARSIKGQRDIKYLVDNGLIKYYKKVDGQRGIWILTNAAMDFLGFERECKKCGRILEQDDDCQNCDGTLIF